MSKRQSIGPTYDHRETGDRFRIETRVGGKLLPLVLTTDPFVFHRVTVGWRDLIRGLLDRRLEVEVIVAADPEMIEDVLELNADYLGEANSSRRREWNEQLERGLREFAGTPRPGSEPPQTASPFPQPPLETVEKGLGRDRVIPGKPADWPPPNPEAGPGSEEGAE